jgi:hypothetical protein
MGDGCSGVLDYGYTAACNSHDRCYHYGGSVEDKLVADGQFHTDMCATPGFWGVIARAYMAKRRYIGVRFFTYNYPPGHSMRMNAPGRIEAWNWLGPGPT